MTRKALALAVLLLLAASCNPSNAEKKASATEDVERTVTIQGQTIYVAVARTERERAQGLMHRESLAADHGMIFVFDTLGVYSFWMKNTLIPLDIIWINGDRIVHIEHNLQPSQSLFPKSYTPDASANFVLEVNGGKAREFGWKVGDEVKIRI